MKWLSLMRTVVVGATLWNSSALSQTADSHTVPSESSDVNPSLSGFIPGEAKLIKEMRVNLKGNGANAIVLAYGLDAVPYVTTGVRILKRDTSGWVVIFEESDSVLNGAGPSDAINIEKVRGAGGKEGVVVVVKNSGAGTTTDWHILASIAGKVVRLESAQIRSKVLETKGYVFQGYNGVTVKGDLVLEDVAGYSPATARCCPDKPSLAITCKFTGSSIKLNSVKELPFEPPPD